MTAPWNLRSSMRSALAAAALIGALAAVPAARADVYTLRIGSGHAPTALYVVLMRDFFVPEVKRRVAERTKHTVNFTEAYGGSIVKVNETLRGVQNGIIDIGGFCVCFEGSNLPLQNFQMALPFGTQSSEQSVRIVRAVHNRVPELAATYEQRFNQRLLALIGLDDYNIGTTFAWTDIAQLKGRKIAGSGPNLAWLEFVGAVPVTGGLPDAYVNMQTKVVDGYILLPSVWLAAKLYEPGPYFTLIGFGAMTIHALTANLATLNRLPPEVRDIIVEVAREYEAMNGKRFDEQYQKAVAGLKAVGARVETLPPAARAAWAQALKDLPAKRAKEMDAMGLPGSRTLQIAIEESEKAGYNWPVRYLLK